MASLQSSDFERLSVVELKACARHCLRIPKHIAGRKASIIAHLLQHESDELRVAIQDALQKKGSY